MDNPVHYRDIELNYRKLYGKLYASLLALFGPAHIPLIEDAIQNAFYKSLKSWKPDAFPQNPLNWLFVVCKNDLLTQLRKLKQSGSFTLLEPNAKLMETDDQHMDPRLELLLFIAGLNNITVKSKILFSLKNVFGLSVKEIQQNTLLGEAAVYKNIKRTQDKILNRDLLPDTAEDEQSIPIILEILYSVFNQGFDVLEGTGMTLDHDIVLEAFALAKQTLRHYSNHHQTKNLMALFCLHVARMPSRFGIDQIIPFYEQDRKSWDQTLIQLGVHYLTKPRTLDRYYLEALITSLHMITRKPDRTHWKQISECYFLLEKLNNSPITRINYAYTLARAGKLGEAIKKLIAAKRELPSDHFYLHLVEAEILRHQYPEQSRRILLKALTLNDHPLRQKLIREKIDSIN
ncbi:MAG: hypothetical protein KDC80_09335 [Saprospiraceae bacterium]|nr:hypothetical protein [Saprospiraceae bacterium]